MLNGSGVGGESHVLAPGGSTAYLLYGFVPVKGAVRFTVTPQFVKTAKAVPSGYSAKVLHVTRGDGQTVYEVRLTTGTARSVHLAGQAQFYGATGNLSELSNDVGEGYRVPAHSTLTRFMTVPTSAVPNLARIAVWPTPL